MICFWPHLSRIYELRRTRLGLHSGLSHSRDRTQPGVREPKRKARFSHELSAKPSLFYNKARDKLNNLKE